MLLNNVEMEFLYYRMELRCTFSKFIDYTKEVGVAYMPEGQAAIQGSLVR